MSYPDDATLNDAGLPDLLRRVLAAEAPAWLETRRWFADKGRGIARVEVADLKVDRLDATVLVLVVARVEFADGAAARYFLPLALVKDETDGSSIAHVGLASGPYHLIDATESALIGAWLLSALAGQRMRHDVRWAFSRTDSGPDLIAAALREPAAVMRAEQSNTSIRYGDALVAKLIRRLQPEPNPEAEVLRALTTAQFPRVPAFAGSATWRAADGTRFPIALAQAFVPNRGDGWSWMLERLRGDHQWGQNDVVEAFAAERLLGQRTAELHLALSRVALESFAPEPSDAASIAGEAARVREQAEDAIRLLREREATLPFELRTRIGAIVHGLQDVTVRLEGFEAEAGYPRVRVHGDYHLGQTLRTRDDDWMIIDFEGEPARPVGERRQKASVLKDVAGMMRSFAYARGVAEREAPSGGDPNVPARWEQGARTAFLAGYRDTLRQSGARLVPDADADFHRALRAWELSKALYEIAYEARNRPDWLPLPIRSLLRGIVHEPPTAGAAPA